MIKPTDPKRYKLQHNYNDTWITQSAYHLKGDAVNRLHRTRPSIPCRVLDSVTGKILYPRWRNDN
jgi:hypothetical protein